MEHGSNLPPIFPQRNKFTSTTLANKLCHLSIVKWQNFFPRRINRECCCYLLISTSTWRKLFVPALRREGVFLCCAPQNFAARHVFALSAVPLFTTHKQTACSLSTPKLLFFFHPASGVELCTFLSTFRAKSRSTRTSQCSATDKNKLSHFLVRDLRDAAPDSDLPILHP